MAGFHQRLKAVREERGLTQRELASIFKLSHGTIGMYERGQREPDQATLMKFAAFFGVSTDYLLGRTDDPEPDTAPSIKLELSMDAIRRILRDHGMSPEAVEAILVTIRHLLPDSTDRQAHENSAAGHQPPEAERAQSDASSVPRLENVQKT